LHSGQLLTVYEDDKKQFGPRDGGQDSPILTQAVPQHPT
jgi:hypothetical protein